MKNSHKFWLVLLVPLIIYLCFISTMTEIECDVYLKLAIAQENYEIAKLIEKQKEKYR